MFQSIDTSVDGSLTPTSDPRDNEKIDIEKVPTNGARDPASDRQTNDPEEVRQIVSHDPSIVDWDSPDDPDNPLNWTKKRKMNATISIALITFLTYVSIILLLRILLIHFPPALLALRCLRLV